MPNLFSIVGASLPRRSGPRPRTEQIHPRSPRCLADMFGDPAYDLSILGPLATQTDPMGVGRRDAKALPKVETVLVTPELVREKRKLGLLNLSVGDAPYQEREKALGQTMEAGALAYAGRTVIVAESGLLLDGLKLLRNVEATGLPVVCHWVSGVHESALAVIDTRKPRPRATYEAAREAVAAAGLGVADPAALHHALSQRISAAWVRLTPAMARTLLAVLAMNGIPHRSASPDNPVLLDVAAGRYLETGQPMVLDARGILRDGAIRADAVAKTGREIWVLMTYHVDPGLPPECFDIGSARTFGTSMQRHGYGQPFDLGSGLAVLHHIERDQPDPTRVEMFETYVERKGLDHAIRKALPHQEHIAQSAHVAARVHLAAHRPAAEIDAFFKRVLPCGKDSEANKAFRSAALAGMTPAQAKVARRLWRRLGDKVSPRGPGERREVASLLIESYLLYHGLPVRRRVSGDGARVCLVRPPRR